MHWETRSYVDKFGDSFDKKVSVAVSSSSSRFKPTTQYIPVPCGWCPDCVRKKQIYLVQRTQGEVIAGNDLFFFTLTYQNKYIPSFEFEGSRFYYVKHSDVRHMFNRIRVNKLLPFDFKYMVVTEYGGKRFRPHLHGIISVKPLHPRETKAEKIARGMLIHDVLLSEWRRNVGSKRKPIWQPLCRYIVAPNGSRTFDCHYVEPNASSNGPQDVAFYVTKYCLKPDPRLRKIQSLFKLNMEYSDYRYFWNLVSPHIWFSKEFGSPYHPAVKAHLLKGVKQSIADHNIYPYWINSDSGKMFPLSPYFQQRFFTGFLKKELANEFDPSLFERWFDGRADWLLDFDPDDPVMIERKDKQHFKRMDLICHRDIIDFFPE